MTFGVEVWVGDGSGAGAGEGLGAGVGAGEGLGAGASAGVVAGEGLGAVTEAGFGGAEAGAGEPQAESSIAIINSATIRKDRTKLLFTPTDLLTLLMYSIG